MHHNHLVKWLKCFRTSPEAICALYDDEGFSFNDEMLDQHDINNKPDLHRLFTLYANKDPDNGFGIHNFRIRSYQGDRRAGLTRWEWNPDHAGVFIGLDVAGKPFGTSGHTFHLYSDKGLITRESSWWDAAHVLRQVGPVSPTKSLTGTKGPSVPKEGNGSFKKAADGMEHAQRWCDAMGNDVNALVDLYADWFTQEDSFLEDHMIDTPTDRTMLAERLGGISSGDNGKYTFTATEWLPCPGGNGGLIEWNLTVDGASTYRGLPTGGKTLTTIGSTFHEFDDEGRVVLESTRYEDNRVFQQLGLPIQLPHYWEEGFDFSAM